MKLHLDFETRSTVDLQKVGAWAYALHPSTEILCMGTGGMHGCEPHVYPAQVLSDAKFLFSDSSVIFSAHNVHFEYAIYNLILHRRFGWPALWDPVRWDCTMARAAMAGLPLGLDALGRALQIKTPKDLEGRRVMLQLCRPLWIDALGDPAYDESPEKFARLMRYNATDVKAEMEIDALLPELPPEEKAVWGLDLAMNRRGFAVDSELARKATQLSATLVAGLNAELAGLTGGLVTKASRIAEIKRFLLAHGVNVPTKYDGGEEKETLDRVAIIETLQRPDLPPVVREALAIRQQVGKSTSTAKYAKVLEMAGGEGGSRIRGGVQYHAAHTGRWSGRLLQPQNLPQGFKEEEQAEAVRLVLTDDGSGTTFSARYGIKAMDALSDSVRGVIVAPRGKLLVVVDYSAIEARGIFWLAGEVSALAAYRRGESPYAEMAHEIYPNLPPSTRHDLKALKENHPQEYDLAKRTVLGAGFGMGAAKFAQNIYTETAKKGKPLVVSLDLAERAIRTYREKYSSVVRFWGEVESAAINAVKNPRQCYAAGAVAGKLLWGMSRDGRFLVCRLPSGRFLWYYKPSVRIGKTPWGAEKGEMVYWGEHSKTREWTQIKTYGGLLAENVTQAVARDIMVNGMFNAEEAGFAMVLTVHDELVTEIDEGARQDPLSDLIHAACALPLWAEGFPVAAEGWVGVRYHKG